jgi:hypothetical protein
VSFQQFLFRLQVLFLPPICVSVDPVLQALNPLYIKMAMLPIQWNDKVNNAELLFLAGQPGERVFDRCRN